MRGGCSDIAGIVLAGGRSSRMGQNKALMDYCGLPLVEHMSGVLQTAGLKNVFISGEVEGYLCLSDKELFGGPAEAIKNTVKKLSGYAGFLFVPVDMPLLTSEVLKFLLQHKAGAYFIDYPLPAFITPSYPENEEKSVRGLLDVYGIRPLDLPDRFIPFMKNTNTPQEWREAIVP